MEQLARQKSIDHKVAKNTRLMRKWFVANDKAGWDFPAERIAVTVRRQNTDLQDRLAAKIRSQACEETPVRTGSGAKL